MFHTDGKLLGVRVNGAPGARACVSVSRGEIEAQTHRRGISLKQRRIRNNLQSEHTVNNHAA